MEEPLLSKPGNYKSLVAYQKAEVIYEITYYFCNKYLHKGDRTIDQMIQAARSGKHCRRKCGIKHIQQDRNIPDKCCKSQPEGTS